MTERTVRVRIAVAVGPGGDWCARGHSLLQDCQVRHQVQSGMPHGQIRWIEADVPLPSEATVEGEVQGG